MRVTKEIKNKELTATIISKIHNIGYYKLIGIGKAFTPWVNVRTLETAVIALFSNELGPRSGLATLGTELLCSYYLMVRII